MKKIVAAAFAASLAWAASPASAMPVGSLDQAQNAMITHVAGGCGPGFHRGPYGGCRPNGGPGPGFRRACPPGFHLGPYGRRGVPFR